MLKWIAVALTTLATALPLSAQDDATLPDGAGKPIVQRMCTGCHKLKVVTSKRATKDQWSATVQQMVARGADGTDDEIATVVDYLAANFPPAEKEKTDPPPATPAPPTVSLLPGVEDSLLTMPPAQVDAMLERWRRTTAHPQVASYTRNVPK
jgi:hypothetical protein